ncbi:MAG: type I glyceraldehyde-3-phosphate dehydrogenase [Nanoarchaeota archaeon]|nr:type I glyceraldehyde-3-phosphate dehydrogenase [Nanoarchaeota archaeon]
MKIAINGFGRIGRAIFKIALEKGINVSAINHPRGPEDAAYILKYDSVYGRYPKTIKPLKNAIQVGNKKIKVLQERDPSKLPWKKLSIDIVVEATGAFRDRAGASKHLDAGAKKVIITAPMKGGKPDLTLVPGVNQHLLKKTDQIISVASCTTNCLAPLVKVLNDAYGIESALMTTIHAYTSSQNLVDGSARKPTRGRAAALNIIPTTTGASDAVIEAIPELKGKIKGMAMRVPVACGSITDLVAHVKKNTTPDQVNKLFKKASQTSMKGIILYNTEPLVSSDIIGSDCSAIFNANETQVINKTVKVLAWYDNEWGYSHRVVDVIKMLSKWAK